MCDAWRFLLRFRGEVRGAGFPGGFADRGGHRGTDTGGTRWT